MKKFLSILCVVFLCAVMTGCSGGKSDKLKFVTSCYPVHIMTLNITEGVENVEIVPMSEGYTGCMHNFQIQSKDLQNIEKSSAFIINGAGFEPFTDKITKEMPKVNVIDSSAGIELLCNEICDDHHENDESYHEHDHEYNSHIWLSVANYIKQVRNVSEGLIKIDPDNAEKYKENTEEYIKKLEALKTNIHEEFKDVEKYNIVVFHDAFPYFAKEFNLNIITMGSGDSEHEISAKEMAEIVGIIKNLKATYIFSEGEISETVKAIAAETGTQIITLNVATSGDSTKDSYINIMRENVQVLKR